ncbi:MAG: hypothetical protein L3J66_09565 [Bacteroidales bacterium]|nr:hypothetical protein [Bacteroidales bacterium]
MIKLEITVQPKTEKYLEFSQSLEFIRGSLQQLCMSLSVTEENGTFSIIATMASAEQLSEILRSTALGILSGAIRILAEKSEVTIHGVGHKRKGSDLREIRLNYLKKEKSPVKQ